MRYLVKELTLKNNLFLDENVLPHFVYLHINTFEKKVIFIREQYKKDHKLIPFFKFINLAIEMVSGKQGINKSNKTNKSSTWSINFEI